jgi:hypothetical protein
MQIVDHSTETSVGLINDVKALFPPQLVTLQNVCWAQPHVRHRYLLGESPDAIYVSFMGTKLPRDMATNANLFQVTRWSCKMQRAARFMLCACVQ